MTEATHDEVVDEESTDRRGMFKRFGVVAAGAAAVSIISEGEANAADGGNMIIGQSNSSTGATTLASTSQPSQTVLLVNDNTTYTASSGFYAAAITGYSQNRGAVYAYTNSTTTPAVVAWAPSSGVPDLQLGDSGDGCIRIKPTSSVSGASALGDVRVNSSGDLITCVTAGTPGTFNRVPSVKAGYTGGAQHLLSSPIRVFDSRYTANSHGNFAGGTGAFANGSTHNVVVCGLTFQTVTIPSGVAGVFGNITAVTPENDGYLSVYPSGGTRPTPSTVNFNKGTTVANSFTAKVGVENAIAIYAFGKTGVIIDIVGFIA